MNAELHPQSFPAFELNPKLEPSKLQGAFSQRGRVRIRNVLRPSVADALYQHLAHRVAWRSFVVAEEKLLGTPPGEPVGQSVDEDKQMLDIAHKGARKGFARVFDSDRVFPEELDESSASLSEAQGATQAAEVRDPVLVECDAFFRSPVMAELFKQVTGLKEIGLVLTQAQRFRPGHFVTFHCGTWSADKTGKRRAMLSLNLTPEWRPEWGGMLEFRNLEADVIESYMPAFNTLDLFAFPQGHWVSPVAPFADGPMLAMAGRLYVP